MTPFDVFSLFTKEEMNSFKILGLLFMLNIFEKLGFEVIHALLTLMKHFCPDLILEVPGPRLLIMSVTDELIRDLACLSLLAMEVEEV